MANAKLTALAEGTVLASTDILYVVVNPDSSPVSKKATIETVVSAAGTVAVEAVTASGTLTGAALALTGGTIAGGTAMLSGDVQVTNITASGTAGTGALTSSGLLTGANIHTAGTIGAASVTTSGNATFTGGTLTLGTIVVARGTNYPAAGTWNAGDILYNSAPAAGTVTGWICTVGGTAGGSWLGFGTL
jgi:cytoskeletal protein CcmA (bactofilin family)